MGATGATDRQCFALYLLCAGFERLLIEKIRVNPRLHLLASSRCSPPASPSKPALGFRGAAVGHIRTLQRRMGFSG